MINPPGVLMGLVTIGILAAGSRANGAQDKLRGSAFGKTSGGISDFCYVATNDNGTEAVVIDCEAALVSLKDRDSSGKAADLVPRYDRVDGYESLLCVARI